MKYLSSWPILSAASVATNFLSLNFLVALFRETNSNHEDCARKEATNSHTISYPSEFNFAIISSVLEVKNESVFLCYSGMQKPNNVVLNSVEGRRTTSK